SGFELLENRIDLIGIEVLVEIVIHLHRRRTGACADALYFFERKRAALLDFAILDAQALLYVLENFVSATQHAGNVRAHLNVILPGRFAAQHRVIRQRLGHLRHVQIEAARDFFEQFVTQPTELILPVKHHGNQRRALHGIAAHELIELCFELWRQLHIVLALANEWPSDPSSGPLLPKRYLSCRCRPPRQQASARRRAAAAIVSSRKKACENVRDKASLNHRSPKTRLIRRAAIQWRCKLLPAAAQIPP